MASAAAQQRGGHRWPVAGPLGVLARVDGVDDAGGAAGCLAHRLGVGGVAGDRADPGDGRVGAAAGEQGDLVAPVGQRRGGGAADASGTDDEMVGHPASCQHESSALVCTQ